MKKNKTYYKIVTPITKNNGIKKMSVDQPYLKTAVEYKNHCWNVAPGNTRLFVYSDLSPEFIEQQKQLGRLVYECKVKGVIHGNGVDYGRDLKTGKYIYVYTAVYKNIMLFWDKVEKNLKRKKKYCTGMDNALFRLGTDIYMVKQVKLIKKL